MKHPVVLVTLKELKLPSAETFGIFHPSLHVWTSLHSSFTLGVITVERGALYTCLKILSA